MKVLIAPDKFRGTFSSRQVSDCMAEGIRQGFPDCRIRTLPMADGGEGTLEILASVLGATVESSVVTGPLGDAVTAEWAWTAAGVAILESAQAVGLSLVSPVFRDPLSAGTEGIGRLIRHCLEKKCGKIYLGLGGTATVDGGAGMARELGYRFLDSRGTPLETASGLEHLHRIDSSRAEPLLRNVGFTALCDVNSPLLGPRGAATMFGPQKGASPDQIPILEERLDALARCVRADLGWEIGHLPMGGAAGGLGAGVVAFLGGKLTPGVDFILDRVGFDAVVRDVDLVLTGEGAVDEGTAEGKVVHGVCKRARERSIPVTVICGRAGGHGIRGARILSAKDITGRDPETPLRDSDLRDLAWMAVRGLI